MIKSSLGEYTVHFEGNENGYTKRIFLGNTAAGFKVINSNLSRHLCALQSMCHELNELHEDLTYTWTKWMNSEQGAHPYVNAYDRTNPLHILLRNVYISALVSYSKCFTSSDSGRKFRLQDKQIKKHYSKEEFSVHRNILRLRNDWVAHGGTSENEDAHTLLIQNPHNNQSRLSVSVNIKHLPDSKSLENIRDATRKLLAICTTLRNEKFQELLKEVDTKSSITNSALQYELRVNASNEAVAEQ